METSAYPTPYPDVNAVLHALLSDVPANGTRDFYTTDQH